MEHQFTLGIPTGESTLSVSRQLSALNRRLVSSDANYRMSIRFSPLSGTADGVVSVSSAANGWCNQSVWNLGRRARAQFYEAMAIEADRTDFSESNPIWPRPIFNENPYDEFRPYLDDAHFLGTAPEINADGTAGVAGEWDYTVLGLFGNDDTVPALDEAAVVFLGDHTDTAGNYKSIGLSELWLQNTNAPGSESNRQPIEDADTDNPMLMLFRGATEDQDEDAMTIITEANRLRPYTLDEVYDTLVLRGHGHFDTDSYSHLTVPSFTAMGGLVRFNNTTDQTIACIVTVHGL